MRWRSARASSWASSTSCSSKRRPERPLTQVSAPSVRPRVVIGTTIAERIPIATISS